MPDGAERIGISTPRRIGNAVQRNRIKRIMRETYRLNRKRFPAFGDLLFLVRNCSDEKEIKEEMLRLSEAVLKLATPPAGKDTATQ